MYLGAPITQKKSSDEQVDNNNNNVNNVNKVKPVSKNSYQLPKDIGPGLLKFCLTHSDSPNLKDSPTIVRDPKDYEWLREAMNNLEDDAKRMKKINETLTSPDTTVGQRVSSLEALEFYIEDIDNSGDYIKIGGVPILIELIKSEDKQVREKSANCLSIISQNEESIQNFMLQIRLDDLAIHLFSSETDSLCREKLLSLISSLLGSKIDKVATPKLEVILKMCVSFLSPTVDIFVPTGEEGSQQTTHSVHNTVSGMSKAAHVLRKIVHGVPSLRSKAIEYGAIEAFIELVRGYNNATVVDPHQAILCEKCESALLVLARGDKKAIEECKKFELLKEVETRLNRMAKTKEENVDEYATVEHLSKLLK